MVEKHKTTLKFQQKKVDTTPKPQDAAGDPGEPKDTAQAAATTQEGGGRVPLRAKKVLTEFEKGFLAAVDACVKVAYEHERATSIATPIVDAIQDLQPPEPPSK